MVTTVADLIVARTIDAIVTEQLDELAAEEFPATSWQPGSVPRSLVKADATAMAAMDSNVSALAKAAFLDDAEGDWLTLHARSRFDVTRVAATYTTGRVTLTVASGAGPYTISAAQLLVTDGVRRWRSTNTSAVTVTSSAPVSIEVRAESAGTSYNVSTGTITSIISPALAGLSVSNPVYSNGTWITTAGADVESDASVRRRCRARWGTLGRGANDAAYEYWARTGHGREAEVTRAAVVWGLGDGTLTIYLAGPSGAVSSGVENAVGGWIETNRPGTDYPTVVSATAHVVSIMGTIRVAAASDSTENRAVATDALATYFAGLDIGEDVDLGELYHALYQARGVIDVDIVQPPGDVSINNNEVAVASLSLTWVPV